MKLKFYIILICCILSINPIKGLLNKHKKAINIAFGINNYSITFLYIALYSLLENSNNNTIYHIYIQIKNSFTTERKKLIYNLEKKFFNCFIHFMNMKRDFKNTFRNSIDISTYYRLKLPQRCPNINRIIHIDADTIILKDLTELFTLNFEGNYILGRLDKITSELDSLGIYTQTYINAGVLLFDLYSLRKYNYVEKFMNYIKDHNNAKYLCKNDQTVINYVCYDKIGILKPRYHMWPFSSASVAISLNNLFRKKYNEKEFVNDYYNPYIVHFPGSFKKNMNRKTRYNVKYNEYIDKIEEIKYLKLESLKDLINYIFLTILIFIKIIMII